MKKQAEFYLSLEEIDSYDLATIEEKLLYIRYLIRREQKEYKLIKFQYITESLERRKEFLRTAGNNTSESNPGKDPG